jgi:hypothetical protein
MSLFIIGKLVQFSDERDTSFHRLNIKHSGLDQWDFLPLVKSFEIIAFSTQERSFEVYIIWSIKY